MALSKSLQSGQVPMSCQMCEESNEIKWKCIQCDFLLCTKCQTLHKKVKSTDQHTIIDIKDIASHKQQSKDKLDFSNIPCGIHAGQNCFLYCQSCEVVVCPLCIIKLHDKHKMIELAKGYEQTMKTVKTFDSEIDQILVQNRKVLSEIGIFKSSEDSKYELEKQNILTREKDLKDEVEKHSNELLKELDQRKKMLMKSVIDAENRSEKIDKDLYLRKQNISQALHANHAFPVFSIYSEEKTSRNQRIYLANTTLQKLPNFVPGNQVIKDFFIGKLTETENDQKHDDEQVELKFKVMKQFKTKLISVNNIGCCDDTTIWICNQSSYKLHKMKEKNKTLDKMYTFNIYVYNMAFLPSGDLLLSTKESNVKIISCSSNKVETTKYNVNPLITLAVHATRNHKILVGVREDQPKSFPVNGPRQVIMMDLDGRIEKVYGTDNKGKQIFTVPFRITTDNDNNIYVIDTVDDQRRGRIIALDKINEVRWIYSGHPDINKEQTLKPEDFVATKSDRIVVTDQDNHMIHILNTAGHCIHYLNTKDQLGIAFPCSVDIDNTGTLYIGCNTYGNDKANIYTVQVSGF